MFFKRNNFSPYTVILISFVIATILGGFLLSLPISSANNSKIRLIDGFFTATSAICVTGLASIDIGDRKSVV